MKLKKTLLLIPAVLIGAALIGRCVARLTPPRPYLLTDLGRAELARFGLPNNLAATRRVTIPAFARPTAHCFLWNDGLMTDLGSLRSVDYRTTFQPDNLGKVVGWFRRKDGNFHAFLWDTLRYYRDLGTLGGRSSYAYAVNQMGMVVGYAETEQKGVHAFVYSGGQMRDLGTLGGAASYAYGLNDSGQVVGDAQTAEGLDRVFFYSDGKMIALGTLGGAESCAYGINNRGEVVGASDTLDDECPHAFLWRHGAMTDLNRLITPHSGWRLREGRGINDRGQITGIGDWNGERRIFLLTPGVEGAQISLATGTH